MKFFRRAAGRPATVGVLAGTFNPPTRAHLALARAALPLVDEVVFVLPCVFPHKNYEGAGFRERLRMLAAALAGEPRFSIASTGSGMFLDIARECRAAYGRTTALKFLCGRDAAERIEKWDCTRSDAFPEMLREFELLVFPRQGTYRPPPESRDRILVLPLEGDFDEVSATEVRNRIAKGQAWEHLVPKPIVVLARESYGRQRSGQLPRPVSRKARRR